MSKSKHTLAEAVLARMSLGAVPMDGIFWFDPKVLRERAEERAAKVQSDEDGSTEGTCHEQHSN